MNHSKFLFVGIPTLVGPIRATMLRAAIFVVRGIWVSRMVLTVARRRPVIAAMESVFSSLMTKRIARKTCHKRNHARPDVFDYIERFSNPTRRRSTPGYLGPKDFEKQANVKFFLNPVPSRYGWTPLRTVSAPSQSLSAPRSSIGNRGL